MEATTLTRIQIAIYLQAVELFTYCTAEQMMRIAAIAQERHFAAGEQIYARDDPALAMYCVVDGRVAVEDVDGRRHLLVAKETFGVWEILSDRLRGAEARAETAVIALAIDAEDFFDLLSNNIEIVKALFRLLLHRSPVEAAVS